MINYEQHKKEVIYTIGAHSVGTILGVNAYSSPYRLYLETREEIEKFTGNERTEIGSFFEETIIKFFLKDHPELTQIFPKAISDRTYYYSNERDANVFVHDKLPFFTGIPDMICKDKEGNIVILEAKNTSEYMKTDWDSCPPMAYFQTLAYLEILKAQYGYVIGLIGGNKFIIHKVERNEADVTDMLGAVEDFYKNLIDGIPPEVSQNDKEAIEELNPEIEDVATEIPYTVNEIFDELEEIKSQQKELENRKNQLENIIRQELGTNSVGSTDKWKASQSDITTNRFDTKKFKIDFGNLYEKYLKQTTSRRLTIKRRNNE